MIGDFTEVQSATAGTVSSQKLLNNHRATIKELQQQVKALQHRGGAVGEITRFLGVRDSEIVAWEIRALLVDTDIE